MNDEVDYDYVAKLKGHLKLSKEGVWSHEGVSFDRKSLSELFFKSIVWDKEQKEYYLQIGRGRAEFELEDTASRRFQ